MKAWMYGVVLCVLCLAGGIAVSVGADFGALPNDVVTATYSVNLAGLMWRLGLGAPRPRRSASSEPDSESCS